ncbi:YhcN/YlaJ family sporulation lipoprotein [Bacillus solimangrovi]|uniref:Spore cortex protein CoxA n=1 Tax=Bacillus solimangrovi TaxID=1305675 RepID=A0A1E5LBM6_9BACI|nr:YhcN/YlaJ family sporulation lipoprotein [Bacillus solimangrovi]OEH91481.1 hypothetical protein BFG57_05030 [Bacillus solimangrovi]
MRKTLLTLSTACLLGGLVGCGANNEALDTRYNDNAQPIGYYTNDTDTNRYRGTGMGDYTMRYENRGTENMSGKNGLNRVGTNQMGTGNYSRNDQNFHRQMNTSLNAPPNGRYYHSNYDGKLAESISRKVSEMREVRDARCVVSENTVLVAIDTNENNRVDIENKVRREVEGMTRGKEVRVVTDRGMYNRITDVDNRLRNGDGMREVGSDIQAIMNDLGNAMSRPFENNR